MTRKRAGRYVGMFAFLFLFLSVSAAQAAEQTTQSITGDTVWSGEQVLSGTIRVEPGVTLTITKGSTLVFRNNAVLEVGGRLDVEGTYREQVVFKKEHPDDPNEVYFIKSVPSGWIDLRYADVSGSGRVTMVPGLDNWYSEISGTIIVSGGSLVAEYSSFHDNLVGLSVGPAATIEVHHSRFFDNTKFDVANLQYQIHWDFQYNWWGRPEGPDPSKIFKGLDTENFLTEDPFATPPLCAERCYSNVLFLPGIMGSRLYETEGGGEKELWVSSLGNRQEQLQMNSDGKSKNAVYTKDDTERQSEINETGLVDDAYGSNLYQSFIDDLRDWKAEGIVFDYAFIPYDWRLSLEDIVMNGKVQDGKLSYTEENTDLTKSYLYQKAKSLQTTSKSGKLTLIGHSNGGLVIKAFVQKLKETNDPLYAQIDRIIFVGVPQTGTPDSIVSLLYGSKIGTLWLGISDRMTRSLGHFMPSMYNLLPSEQLFGPINPPIEFAGNNVDPSWKERYGDKINTYSELKDFLTGKEGRERPEYADTAQPEVLSDTLLNLAEADHEVLDDWTPASDTEVIQIAGWGLYTVAGLKVIDEKLCQFDANQLIGGRPVCSENRASVTLKDKLTLNGDETVLVSSALHMGEGSKVKKYWVDLANYNKENESFLTNRVHKNILEIESLRSLIESLIKGSGINFQYISDTEPVVPSDVRYVKYEIHSPLHLAVTDAEGNKTGWDSATDTVVEQIRGTQYFEIGEIKTLLIPKDTEHVVELKAYAQGSFTLDIEELDGEETVNETKFEAIPVLESSSVEVVPASGNEPVRMSIDFNADGLVETELEATPDEAVEYENPEIPDTLPPEITVTFDQVTKDVTWQAIDSQDKDPSVVVTSTEVTAADKAGNVTMIPFTKYREGETRLKVQFEEVVYNAEGAKLPKTTLVYDWKLKEGKLTDLDTELRLKDKSRLKAEYRKKKDETKIVEKDKKEKTKTEVTKPGFVSVQVETNQGNVGWKY